MERMWEKKIKRLPELFLVKSKKEKKDREREMFSFFKCVEADMAEILYSVEKEKKNLTRQHDNKVVLSRLGSWASVGPYVFDVLVVIFNFPSFCALFSIPGVEPHFYYAECQERQYEGGGTKNTGRRRAPTEKRS